MKQGLSVVPDSNIKHLSVLVSLPSSSRLYEILEQKMKTIGSSVKIISIEIIKNPLLEGMYEAVKKIIAKQCKGYDPNERELFHGAHGLGIDGIKENAFDDRYFNASGDWGNYFIS
ncbi:unnamed protein product [Rotaria sp. Silwood2]|nr:unnamed protein product [Rotaria sp. Silwood2]